MIKINKHDFMRDKSFIDIIDLNDEENCVIEKLHFLRIHEFLFK